jgi:cellulose synthase/poly-beta-1,6-N-acetylglucosamine synthase-like glycosyltransferase/spore germination protein YaaH/peptidoglycan/xylan/chitin deacetylase (PgdA/CDA1 family)
METNLQIFQTSNKWRWRTFVWLTRIVIVVFAAMLPVIFLAYTHLKKPVLPLLANEADTLSAVSKMVRPRTLDKKEARRYKGFNQYLKARQKTTQTFPTTGLNTKRIRAAFFVDWDPQSMFSLQANINKLNMVIPEWFFIDPNADTLMPKIDADALSLMKKHPVEIIPILNNINQGRQGTFDGAMLHRIFHNPAKRERLINDIVKYLLQYKLQGINIDFEEFKETSDEPIIAFQRDLYHKLHEHGLIVTQDVMPDNNDYNFKEIQKYNDYVLLMAYDQHWNESIPGPLCEQRWIEKELETAAKQIPAEKIILCLAGYGYDWAEKKEATNLTYQQALATAQETKSTINFDNDTYNCNYTYTDGDSVNHIVYFTDAAGNYNTMRYADTYGTAGTALWRLGSEDERIWNFYNLSLDDASLDKKAFDYNELKGLHIVTSKPDYIGDGEILNVMSTPQPGKIDLEINKQDNLVAEERYIQLPTRYVIKKYGNVHNQVVLTFDDGPDADYTPKILKILHDEKVPATFFVVGINAESNIPLLRRIYNEGHEIGNHTFTHPNIAMVSTERALSEMDATRLLIESVTGRSTVLFRAPYNADSEPTHAEELKPVALSRANNYYTVGESIDPEDWEPGITADSIYIKTIRQYERNPEKGIILFHDAGGNRQATVDALPMIIHYFKDHGVQFTTVAALLHKTKNDIMPVAKSNLLQLNGGVADTFYYIQRILEFAFWLSISLGLLRVIMLATLTWLQGKRAKLEKPLLDASVVKPAVSIIVPAYNESINAVKTIHNLLQQDYPALKIIFVDDGSKDDTFQLVHDAFGIHPDVMVITKPNGGKASALNTGIALATTEYLVCIDADTQLQSDAVSQLMKYFVTDLPGEYNKGSMVGAVAGNVKVGNETTILTKWQSIEYITAQNFDRRAFDLINGITVVPGAIGAFRKKAIDTAGGFTTDTLAEDCDLTIRIIKAGYTVRNCGEAIAVTEAPESLKQFMKQRFRWSYGVIQSFFKHRETCFNPAYKGLGILSMPNILLFQIILPLVAPFADLMLLYSIVWSSTQPENFERTLVFYIIFLVVDVFVSLFAFSFEKEKTSKLLWLIPQRFVYRQLMYVTLFRALRKAIKGENQGWGALKRTGNVKQLVSPKGEEVGI